MRAFRVGLAVAMLACAVHDVRAEDPPTGAQPTQPAQPQPTQPPVAPVVNPPQPALTTLATDFTSTSQELRDDGNHTLIAVPFKWAPGVDPTKVSARTTRVMVGSVDRGELVPAFAAAIDRSQGAPRLAITVGFGPLVKPATYAVEVELVGPPPSRQTVPLQLTHPGATLRPTGTLVVLRTHHWIAGDTYAPMTLPLVETSGRARLARLRGVQLDRAKHGSEQVSGSLAVEPVDVAPDDVAWATITMKDDFPVGTTTGQLELRAPQLAAPVVVSYEVRTRLPDWYVLPIFFIAGFFGWFFRVFLKQREEAAAQRLQVESVREKLERARASHPLDDERDALAKARRELDEAQASGKSAAITAAVTAADTALTKAAASRVQFRTDLVAELRGQREVLSRRWQLPATLTTASALSALAAAEAQVAVDQLTEAAAERLAARERIADLHLAAKKWAIDAAEQLAAIAVPPGQADWSARLAAVKTALDAVPRHDPQAQPKAETFLPALHAAGEAIAIGLPPIARGLTALAAQIGAAFGTTLPAQAQAAAIARAVAIDAAVLEAGGAPAIAALASAIGGLSAAVRAAIVALYPNADLKAVDAKLAEGSFTAAVAAARPAAAAMGGGVEVANQQPLNPAAAAGGAAAGSDRGARPEPGAGAPAVTVTIAAAREPALVARRARALRTLAWAQAGRAALSLVISTIGAYFVYRGSFVGTASEIAAIAAVAFTTEFTVEHAIESIGKPKAAPPPG